MATTTRPTTGSRTTRARDLGAPRGGRARSAVGRRSSFSSSPSPDAPANALSRYRRKVSNHPLVTCDDPAGWRRGARMNLRALAAADPDTPDAAAQLRRRPRRRPGRDPDQGRLRVLLRLGDLRQRVAVPRLLRQDPPPPRRRTPRRTRPPGTSQRPLGQSRHDHRPARPGRPALQARRRASGTPGSTSPQGAAWQRLKRRLGDRRAHHRPGVHLGRRERLAPALPRPAGPRPGPGRRRHRRSCTPTSTRGWPPAAATTACASPTSCTPSASTPTSPPPPPAPTSPKAATGHPPRK